MIKDSNAVQRFKPHIRRPLLGFLGVWVAITLIFAGKIPSSYTKIYAEDGTSLQQSLENPFPQELFEPVAGYLDVLLRGAGAVVSLFPLEFAPIIFFLFNTMLLAILWVSVFISSRSLIDSYRWRILLATGLILLPIGNFESIANSANLHFYFMSACVPILLSTPRNWIETIFLCTVVFLSACSIPLMLFTFPLILIKELLKEKGSKDLRGLAIILSWLSGNALQIFFISSIALGQRKSTGINYFTEVLYLFLDRVFGSTIIPFWGMVSSSTQSPFPKILGTSNYLILRAVIALSVLFILIVLGIKHSHFTLNERWILLTIVGTGVIHWLIVGLIFNPEPRYAIFSSFCFFIAIAHLLQNLYGNQVLVEYTAITILLFTWIGSWSPSDLRTEGPSWNREFKTAQLVCASGAKDVEIPTIPINRIWQIKLNCQNILKNP